MPEVCVQKKETDAACAAPCRVLFICTGNTCRSPMAAAALADRALAECAEAPRFVAASAGLYAVVGAPITPAAAEALAARGIVSRVGNNYNAHRAHTVTREDLANADEVVAMSAAHAMELLFRFPEYASKIFTFDKDIPDPFGKDAATYRACLDTLCALIGARWFGGDA